MMFYDTNYRSTRSASVIAVLLVLMGAAFLVGFLFIRFDTGVGEGDGDFNWSLVSIFIPIFIACFASIIAAVSAQKQKQYDSNKLPSVTVQNKQLAMEMEMEKKNQERLNKQADRIKRPKFAYCSYCGEKMIGEAQFCSQCGTEMRL